MTSPDILLNINSDQTRQLLEFPELIETLRAAFAAEIHVPLRHHHFLPQPDGTTATLLLMPSWSEEYIGIKLVTIFPGNTKRNIPGLYSTYLLCDSLTGKHLALIDGNQITVRRTVAASALAASYLSRENASNLLVIGAGRVASHLPYAYKAVRPIQKVKVWDINAALAAHMVNNLKADGFDAEVAQDLKSAVEQADIVTSATLSREALIHGEWLRPGVHIDMIGGFTPEMRESDDAVFANAAVFVDSMDALEEAGDLMSPIKNGVLNVDKINTLPMLCKQTTAGRTSNAQITVFKAVGTALSDIASAALVYRKYSRPQ